MVISVLCATDAVAAVTLIKEKQFPVLNSVLAGEGIINDGIAIAIYRAILVLKD
jgi:sodium/hydrogen exchanger-like protein 6/7